MHTHFYSGSEGLKNPKGHVVAPSSSRKPIFGIYNSYYKIRGLLVPISEAPAMEE